MCFNAIDKARETCADADVTSMLVGGNGSGCGGKEDCYILRRRLSRALFLTV